MPKIRLDLGPGALELIGVQAIDVLGSKIYMEGGRLAIDASSNFVSVHDLTQPNSEPLRHQVGFSLYLAGGHDVKRCVASGRAVRIGVEGATV